MAKPLAVDVHERDLYTQIGARIRKLREEAKLSQEQLAQGVGLTRTSITNVEQGKQKMLLHTFVEIAHQLSVDPAEMLRPAVGPPSTAAVPRDAIPSGLPAKEREFIERGLAVASKRTRTPARS